MKSQVKVLYPDAEVFEFEMEHEGDHESLLEQIFAEWNNGSGQECERFLNAKCRSLSLNDFVTIDGDDYQCRGIGWCHVTPLFVNRIERLVALHPKRFDPEYSVWACLEQVMWDHRKNLPALGV
jgi:hypothetical protein